MHTEKCFLAFCISRVCKHYTNRQLGAPPVVATAFVCPTESRAERRIFFDISNHCQYLVYSIHRPEALHVPWCHPRIRNKTCISTSLYLYKSSSRTEFSVMGESKPLSSDPMQPANVLHLPLWRNLYIYLEDATVTFSIFHPFLRFYGQQFLVLHIFSHVDQKKNNNNNLQLSTRRVRSFFLLRVLSLH